VLLPVDHQPSPESAVLATRRASELLGVDPVTASLLHIGQNAPPVCTPPGNSCTWRSERRDGNVVKEILAAAEHQQAGLVVMATAGREGPLEALLGSTTERVLRRLRCPLLAVPAGG
jgi:nucleotide-binding universal stress UspA family protein